MTFSDIQKRYRIGSNTMNKLIRHGFLVEGRDYDILNKGEAIHNKRRDFRDDRIPYLKEICETQLQQFYGRQF